jgi:hypothetical protein
MHGRSTTRTLMTITRDESRLACTGMSRAPRRLRCHNRRGHPGVRCSGGRRPNYLHRQDRDIEANRSASVFAEISYRF